MSDTKDAQASPVSWGSLSSLDDLSAPALTALYLRCRREFRQLIKQAERLSRGAAGIPSTGNRMFWGAILFMRLGITAKSIERLLPDTKPREHWDFGAVAALVRVLLEASIVYNWLCGEGVDEEERKGRFILLYLHDYGSRKRLFPEQFNENNEVYQDLVRQFDSNSFLSNYDEKQRKVALRGEKTPFVQDNVLEQMGSDPDHFRLQYRFLSQHTHTGPIAFYRIMEHDRGTGVETMHEKSYMIYAINAAYDCLAQAIEEHLIIFPDAGTRAPHLTWKQIEDNVEIAQGRRRPLRRRQD